MDSKQNTSIKHPEIHSRAHYGLVFLLILSLGGCAASPVKEEKGSSGYDGLYGGSDELKRTHKAGKSAETADAAIALGDQSYQKGEYDQAVFHYIQALDLNDGDATTLNKIGDIQVATENYEIAAQAYQKSINLEPDNRYALQGLGLIQLRNRQYEKARDNLSAALKVDPDLWRAHNALGTMADLQGDYTAAKYHYRDALAINPRSVQIINNYGYSYYLSGEWDAALDQFRKAININPAFERVWYNVGLVYARQGKLDDALGAFDNVMKRPQAYNDIGYICMLDGNYSAAENYFRKAVRSSSSFYKKAHDNIEKIRRLRAQRASMPVPGKKGTHAGGAVTLDDGMAESLHGSQIVSSTPNRMAKTSSGNRFADNRQEREAVSIRSPENSGRIITSRARDATVERPVSSVSRNSPDVSPVTAPVVPPLVNIQPDHSPAPESAASHDNVGHAAPGSGSANHSVETAGIAGSDSGDDPVANVKPEPDADVSIVAGSHDPVSVSGNSTGSGESKDDEPGEDIMLSAVGTRQVRKSAGAVGVPGSGPVSSSPEAGESAHAPDVEHSTSSGVTPVGIAGNGDASATRAAVTGDREEHKVRYEKALSMLKKGEYTQATEAFEHFLADYPEGSYAGDATYNLGQAYYFLQDHDQAMAMFSKLIDSYPQSPMQASARFFIGNLHYQNQEWNTAREKLYRVVTDYPESIPAQLAENRLRDMRQNGH